ncbi:MAG TPA: allantoate amidohydrolase [Streptosporangiaceae bacterium]|nr:allantoate amidohydrolase [Streptosporangiaceae bacterium]
MSEPAAWQLPLWQSLLPLGRSEVTGGYRRFSFTPAETECRDWFRREAERRGLRVETDQNTNLWAWWDPAEEPATDAGAIVTGSHLDSVPDGGAFDGPLGVVSAFVAIDLLAEAGQVPVRPVGVVAFTEEEGGRFGVSCLGSRLLTGAIEADAARALTDGDGVDLAAAMTDAGLDPAAIGPDSERIAGIDAFIELHVEQGSALAGMHAAVGVAESIWPHGRWRIDFSGRADHAGTTKLTDRHDPMLPYAATVLAARTVATELGARATFGKVRAEPGAANAISSAVHAWLDARAPDEETLKEMVGQLTAVAELSGKGHGVSVSSRCESLTPIVEFDRDLRDRVVSALARRGIDAPVLPTGAGHDAGILAAGLPTAMLFVRNPTGVSHSPAEHAEPEDCEAGVVALAAVLEELACQ